jgi:hypothetical protein
MKKFILIAVALVVMAGTGFVIARRQKRSLKFPPHTIVYRLSSYDASEKLISTEIVIRRVDTDGNWKHTQVRPDGSVQFSNGKLKTLITATTQADQNSPEHLQVKYIAERNRKGDVESWISPELQDYLLLNFFRPDGTKDQEMKAVDISRP